MFHSGLVVLYFFFTWLGFSYVKKCHRGIENHFEASWAQTMSLFSRLPIPPP